METIQINGKSYLIDIEKATEQGLLKEKDNKPRSWEEYAAMRSQDCDSIISATGINDDDDVYICDYDLFNSEDEARAFVAFVAFGKLIQLRDAWWGEWRPNWEEADGDIYVMYYNGDLDHILINKIETCYNSRTLAFPTEEMCDDFLSTFRDLIEQAKMFL